MGENFLTIEEFQNKFKIKINYLHYLQLIAAIPSDFKKKAATIEVPSQELLNTAKLSSSVIRTLDLTEMCCKIYYKILNGDYITEPTGIENRYAMCTCVCYLEIIVGYVVLPYTVQNVGFVGFVWSHDCFAALKINETVGKKIKKRQR